jgi:hypothetical protein
LTIAVLHYVTKGAAPDAGAVLELEHIKARGRSKDAALDDFAAFISFRYFAKITFGAR